MIRSFLFLVAFFCVESNGFTSWKSKNKITARNPDILGGGKLESYADRRNK